MRLKGVDLFSKVFIPRPIIKIKLVQPANPGSAYRTSLLLPFTHNLLFIDSSPVMLYQKYRNGVRPGG